MSWCFVVLFPLLSENFLFFTLIPFLKVPEAVRFNPPAAPPAAGLAAGLAFPNFGLVTISILSSSSLLLLSSDSLELASLDESELFSRPSFDPSKAEESECSPDSIFPTLEYFGWSFKPHEIHRGMYEGHFFFRLS